MQELHWWDGNKPLGSKYKSSYHPGAASLRRMSGHNGPAIVIPNKTLRLSSPGYSLWVWIESDLTAGWRREREDR